MAKCAYCEKALVFGNQVSHSHRRSNRPWKPNLKRVKAIVEGSPSMCMSAPAAFAPARSPRGVSLESVGASIQQHIRLKKPPCGRLF